MGRSWSRSAPGHEGVTGAGGWMNQLTVDWFIGSENRTSIGAAGSTWIATSTGRVARIVGAAAGIGSDPAWDVRPTKVRDARTTRAALQLRAANEALGIGRFHHRTAVRAGDELFPSLLARFRRGAATSGLPFGWRLLRGRPCGRRGRGFLPAKQEEPEDEEHDDDERQDHEEPVESLRRCH